MFAISYSKENGKKGIARKVEGTRDKAKFRGTWESLW